MKALGSIAGYELKKFLGTTGPTDTYQARGARVGGTRSVAFKLLCLDRLPAEMRASAAARFLAAGRRAAGATVGGMAAIVEVSEDPAVPFVASELVPGIDLAYLVKLARKRKPEAPGLEPSLAGALTAQVARILTSAHESSPPLHHLGLGPSNVRVTPTAGVMVVDFGLGASLRGLSERGIEGWYFLPPELLTVDAATGFDGSGEAADLYSLGSLLCFLLTGQAPIQAGSLTQLVERSWEPLPAIPGAPDKLNRAIRLLAHPEPRKRTASAREAAEMLSGDVASPQERHMHIAAALRGLGISERPKKPAAAPKAEPAAPSPSPPALAVRHTPKSAVRRPARSWQRWRVVVFAAGLIAVVAGAWEGVSLVRKHARQRAARLGDVPIVGALTPPPILEVEIPGGELAQPSVDSGPPTDRVYVPSPRRKLPRVPSHLDLDTIPSQADVWVDGVLRGKSPVDLDLGPGGHRVVLVKQGYRFHKDVYDTTHGEYIRLQLRPIGLQPPGGAFLNLKCNGSNHYPILVDDDETGYLCPTAMLPVLPGRRKVGVFVPMRRAAVSTEVDVPKGPKPFPVTLQD